jgi:hypothetical protein
MDVSLIQSATESISAASSLLDAVIDVGSKIGYTITVIAAFIPPQPQGAVFYWPCKIINAVACNFKHAANSSTTEFES